MRSSKELSLAARTAASIALAAAISIVPAGFAVARVHHKSPRPANARQYYGLYRPPAIGLPPAEVGGSTYDQSGTLGREGEGASPFYPEGPGNFSD